MRTTLILLVSLIPLAGCARKSATPASQEVRKPQVNPQAVAARWQFPSAKLVSGGFTAGLYHTSFTSGKPYEKVWEFYAKRAGFPPKYRSDARAVESECRAGPEPCSAHAVESHNTKGFRSATFALRGPERGVVAAVSRADSEKQTHIQLTIIAP